MSGTQLTVELTVDGNLRMDAADAATLFPSDALVAMVRDDELWLFPLTGPESGGLLFKQRNARGDRSALVAEVLPLDHPHGPRLAVWDEQNGAVRVDVRTNDGSRVE